MPNVGSRFQRVTQLEILPPNTISRFQPMDASISASLKAQYRKLVIQYRIDRFNANNVFAIEHASRAGVTTSTIQIYWRHTGVLLISIERELMEARRLINVDEVATLLHQLTLLSFDSEVGDVMNAHEYLNYDIKFNLNNPYELTIEEFLDMYSS